MSAARREIARAFAGYALVTAVLAWPWISSATRAFPAGALLVAPSDARLHVWILAWVARALTTAPSRIFDGPIAYPAPGQLASAEHMLSSQLLFLPVWQLTGNALLGVNVLVLVSYPLAAVAMQRLLLRLGVSSAPAWVGGLVYALGPLRVAGNLHVAQYLNFYLPLVALAVLRLRERPTAARAAALGVVFLLALFSSYYLAAMACVVGAAWAAREVVRAAPGRRRFAALATVALAVPLGLLVLFSRPYLARPEAGGFTLNAYPGDEMMYAEFAYVPGLLDLLRFVFPSGAWHATPEMLQDPAFWGRVALGILVVFVRGWFGSVPLVLAGLGLLALRSPAPGARRAARWGLVLAVLATLLMLGPMQVVMGRTIALPFAWILTTPARFFRFPFRFIVVAGFGTALLAAAALEDVRRRLGARAGWAIAAVAALLVLATHGRRLAGTGLDQVVGQTAPVYAVVAAETAAAPGPLLELPLQDRQGRGLDREAMVGSTRHWLPLVNGFTGFPARHRDLLRAVIGRLPAADALADLVDLTHVRWLLLHPEDAWPDPAVRRAIVALPEVRQVATSDGWVLLRVEREPERPEWFAAVARGEVPDRQPVPGSP